MHIYVSKIVWVAIRKCDGRDKTRIMIKSLAGHVHYSKYLTNCLFISMSSHFAAIVFFQCILSVNLYQKQL